jgi:hypothetical protein
MLRVSVIERLHRMLEGDPETEAAVLSFIANRYKAKSLGQLPKHIAAEILRRPVDFLIAARKHYQGELELEVTP